MCEKGIGGISLYRWDMCGRWEVLMGMCGRWAQRGEHLTISL